MASTPLLFALVVGLQAAPISQDQVKDEAVINSIQPDNEDTESHKFVSLLSKPAWVMALPPVPTQNACGTNKISTAEECRAAAESLGLPVSNLANGPRVYDTTWGPPGCWAQQGQFLQFNKHSSGGNCNKDFAQCICRVDDMRLFHEKEKLVAYGKYIHDHCGNSDEVGLADQELKDACRECLGVFERKLGNVIVQLFHYMSPADQAAEIEKETKRVLTKPGEYEKFKEWGLEKDPSRRKPGWYGDTYGTSYTSAAKARTKDAALVAGIRAQSAPSPTEQTRLDGEMTELLGQAKPIHDRCRGLSNEQSELKVLCREELVVIQRAIERIIHQQYVSYSATERVTELKKVLQERLGMSDVEYDKFKPWGTGPDLADDAWFP